MKKESSAKTIQDPLTDIKKHILMHTSFNSSMGTIFLTSHDNILTGVYFAGQKHQPDITSIGHQNTAAKIFLKTEAQILEYLAGTRHTFDIEYQCIGTALQEKVWAAITKISYGDTISYKELAKYIGKPTSIRAVAAAVGRNPLSLIIPCHRIIGSNGALVGYAGGLQRKKELLSLEQI